WTGARMEPLGACLPNGEIFRRLAARLGLDDDAFRDSDAAMLDELLASAPAGIDTAELRANGFTKIDLGQGALPHAAGGFRTPSGKLQLRAETLADRGIDPLPHYPPPRRQRSRCAPQRCARATPARATRCAAGHAPPPTRVSGAPAPRPSPGGRGASRPRWGGRRAGCHPPCSIPTGGPPVPTPRP